jgi:hypothetical protein
MYYLGFEFCKPGFDARYGLSWLDFLSSSVGEFSLEQVTWLCLGFDFFSLLGFLYASLLIVEMVM